MMYDMNRIYMYERLRLLDLVDIYEDSFIIVGPFYMWPKLMILSPFQKTEILEISI